MTDPFEMQQNSINKSSSNRKPRKVYSLCPYFYCWTGENWQGHTPHFIVRSRRKCKYCHSELGRDVLQSGPLALPWTSEAAPHFSCSSIFHDCEMARRLRSCVSRRLRRPSCIGWLSLSGGRTRWKSSGRWYVCTSVTKTTLDQHKQCSYFWPRSQEGPGAPCCCQGARYALIPSSSASSSSAVRGYSQIDSCLFWASYLD